MVDSPASDIIKLAIDPVGDPRGRRLSAAINAHFALERATHRRRRWTAALALVSVPAVASLLVPSLMGKTARNLEVMVWLAAGVAQVNALARELRAARAVTRR